MENASAQKRFSFAFIFEGERGNDIRTFRFDILNFDEVKKEDYEIEELVQDQAEWMEWQSNYQVVHDCCANENDIAGFNTYEAKETDILPIMNLWKKFFESIGYRCGEIYEDEKNFKIEFTAKKIGAIGMETKHIKYEKGKTIQEVMDKLYKKYEHVVIIDCHQIVG